MSDLADRLYWRLLVLRCQGGDAAALEELVAQSQPRLRGFLFKMLPGANLDDVAQDVWMDVMRDLRRLEDPGAFVPWFYRIAHNRVFRLLRRNRSAAVSIDGVEVAEPGPADEFTAEDAAAVHAALDKLAPEYREALLLRFMDDLSYEQIATIADCPVGTVRSRIHNGKRQLRAILERKNE